MGLCVYLYLFLCSQRTLCHLSWVEFYVEPNVESPGLGKSCQLIVNFIKKFIAIHFYFLLLLLVLAFYNIPQVLLLNLT